MNMYRCYLILFFCFYFVEYINAEIITYESYDDVRLKIAENGEQFGGFNVLSNMTDEKLFVNIYYEFASDDIDNYRYKILIFKPNKKGWTIYRNNYRDLLFFDKSYLPYIKEIKPYIDEWFRCGIDMLFKKDKLYKQANGDYTFGVAFHIIPKE